MHTDDSINGNFLHGIVKELYFDIDIASKNASIRNVPRKTRQACKSIAWKYSAKMAYDITVIIVF